MRLHDFFDFHAREHPSVEFAVQDGRRLSYGEALDLVNRQATAFVGSGVAQGDRVAILSKNSVEYALTYLAASKAGAVAVPLNYRLAPPELVYIINDAQAKVLLASSEYCSVVDGIRGELKTVTSFVAIGEGRSGHWDGFERWRDFSAPTSGRDIRDTDDVYQMYTSGTTGRPKGAVLTHGAVSSNIVQLCLYLRGEPGERWLIVAPMYHAAAAVTVFCCLYWGGSLFIMPDFNPAEVVRVLSGERIALTTLVPAMIQACLVHVPDVAKRRYDSLRFMSYGGSPISEETLRRALEVFGCEFGQGYGMTETTAALTYLPPQDHLRALRGRKPELLVSAGRALMGTEIRVVDDEDRPVPHGTIGQIIGRGPQLMRGYWNQEDASRDALRGGWMHTGDAGIMDDEGFVYIQDRVKDMIVSGGENVYPREVEEILFKHPLVADAAVISVPDDRFGEAVKAVVVVREGHALTESELIDFCRDKLAGYKRPRSVDFVVALPRNPSGKVLKRELREKYWAGHHRRVG